MQRAPPTIVDTSSPEAVLKGFRAAVLHPDSTSRHPLVIRGAVKGKTPPSRIPFVDHKTVAQFVRWLDPNNPGVGLVYTTNPPLEQEQDAHPRHLQGEDGDIAVVRKSIDMEWGEGWTFLHELSEQLPECVQMFGKYNIGAYCAIPSIATAEIVYGQRYSAIGLESPPRGSVQYYACLSGQIKFHIFPNRQVVHNIFSQALAPSYVGEFISESSIKAFSLAGVEVWEVLANAGDVVVMPATFWTQSFVMNTGEGSGSRDVRAKDAQSDACIFLCGTLCHVDNIGVELDREKTNISLGVVPNPTAWPSWRLMVAETVRNLARHIREPDSRMHPWCTCLSSSSTEISCSERLCILQPIVQEFFALDAKYSSKIDRGIENIDDLPTMTEVLLCPQKTCFLCGSGIFNTYFICDKCVPERNVSYEDSNVVCLACCTLHCHGLIVKRTFRNTDVEDIPLDIHKVVQTKKKRSVKNSVLLPKLSDRSDTHMSTKQDPQKMETLSSSPSSISYNRVLPPSTKRRKVSRCVSLTLPTWRCHVCRRVNSLSIQCPKEKTHRWCAFCLMQSLNIAYSDLITNMTGIWSSGCPICTKTCPCTVCTAKRRCLISTAPPIIDEKLKRMYSKDLVSPVLQEEAIPTPLLQIVGVPWQEWTTELYNVTVLEKKIPALVEGFANDWDKDLWSLNYLEKNCRKMLLMVRYQAVQEDDPGSYLVLKDQQKSVGWFLDRQSGKIDVVQGDPDFEWAQSIPNCRDNVVVYAKDFLFEDTIPEWTADMNQHLPIYLKSRGVEDMLRYIPEKQRPVTLMAYIGDKCTRTPFHVDKLNTIAFNIHVHGPGVKKWWLVHPDDKRKLENLIAARGGHLHNDNFWCDPKDLQNSGMRVWTVDQREGDLVIVPPGVPHQVLNLGGLSMAVAANVMNEHTIELNWEMDKNYRRLRVESVYRLKTIVYCGIVEELAIARASLANKHSPLRSPLKLQRLCRVFEHVVEEEVIELNGEEDKVAVQCTDEVPHTRKCDYCHGDIFNRRYHCDECGADVNDGADLCLQCFASVGKDHKHIMYLVQVHNMAHLQGLLQDAKSTIKALEKAEKDHHRSDQASPEGEGEEKRVRVEERDRERERERDREREEGKDGGMGGVASEKNRREEVSGMVIG